MKPIDIKSSTYIDFNKKNNKDDPKFEVDDHVRISKYKIFLQIVTFQIDLKKFLWLKQGFGTFYEKELKKTSPKRVEN